MNREERNSLIGTMTTLCYLEKDDSYLMLHRVKKRMTSIRTNGSVSVDMHSPMKVRRTACFGK